MRKIFAILILLIASNAWAVTERLKTICPSGCDYTGLQAAIVGEADDLEADNVYLSLAITEGFTDTTAVNISQAAWNTDATRYINIYTTGAARHDGKWASSAYILYPSTNSRAIAIGKADLFVRITGLQIKLNNTTQYGTDYISAIDGQNYNANIQISKNIITINSHANSAARYLNGIGGFTSGSAVVRVWDNIIYGFQTHNATFYFYGISLNGNFLTAYSYNNTCYGNDINHSYGGTASVTSVYVKNNIGNGSYSVDYVISGDGVKGTATNLSEDTSSPDASLRSKAVTFADEVGLDFHLASGDANAKNAGTNLTADAYNPFNDDIDIDDDVRQAPWDIGADEINVPPPTRLIYIH